MPGLICVYVYDGHMHFLGACFHSVCASMGYRLSWVALDDILTDNVSCTHFWEPHCSFQTRVFIELLKNPRTWIWKHFENQWSDWFTAVCREKLSRGQEVSLPHYVVSHTLHEQNTTWSWTKKKIRSALRFYLSDFLIIWEKAVTLAQIWKFDENLWLPMTLWIITVT